MGVQIGYVTVEEFERIAAQPDNADKRLEYIGGEIVEMVSDNYPSLIALRLGGRVMIYVEEHDLGYALGADGGFMVSGERYMPDIGFISKQKQPTAPHGAWNPNAPDLAVEVMSPSDDPEKVRIKVVNYLNAGTVVWLVNPEKQQVEVYTPGHPAHKVDINGTLDGGDVLPGFRLPLKMIFPEHTDD